jgi:glucose/arabinose dehydrogenase
LWYETDVESASIRIAAAAASLAMLAGSGAGQTAREAAVAIDRVEVPRGDSVDLQRVAGGLRAPWSMAFLPDGRMLLVEKYDGMRILGRDGSPGRLLDGLPGNVLRKEDSGFLDVALDPDFARNRRLYLAFAEGSEDANRTAVWRGELAGDRLVGGRVIFRTNFAKKGTSHPGGRLLFLPDATLLLTVGDGFEYRDAAQDPASHLGKVLRLSRDGAAPPDNPFVGRAGHAPEVWTLGHRNIQGLARDPATGLVWAHEHGPRGGDEINRLQPGRNYGWPLVSHGIGYDGKVITERAFAPGMEPSHFYWAPSIAPSGLAIYRGGLYPGWDGRFLVGALAARLLVRLRIGAETGLFVEEERLFGGLKARIRDVRGGPDGHLYLLTDDPSDGLLLRLVPKNMPAR